MFMDICIMHILITAATLKEVQDTSNFFEEKKNEAQNIEIQIAVTGIGLMSTTFSLTKLIHEKRPDIIIQAGIAGCFSENKNNTVVSVSKDLVGDIGVCENDLFKNIFDLKLADKDDFPFNDGWLMNPYQKLLSIADCKTVHALSVNEITTDKKRIEWYQQKYAPFVESMEGAAFHYVCLQEKIPFLQLRSVSNYIGERNKSNWTMKDAIIALNEKLLLLIKKISDYDESYFRI
jgi:futalosine hydrolase